MSARVGRIRLLRPLGSRDFLLLWSGVTVSLLGDGVYLVAVAWQVLDISNSALALSAVGVAVSLPPLVFPLVAGVLSDRLDRRLVMIGADLLRMVAVLGLAAVGAWGQVELWHVLVVAVAFGIGESFFLPAFSAVIPQIVSSEDLVAANSLNQFVRPLAFRLAGPALGGALVAALGTTPAFALDGLSFAVSAACIALMRARPALATGPEDVSLLSDLREGLRFVRTTPWLWASVAAAALGLLAFYGPFETLVPLLVRNELDAGAKGLGLVMGAGGAGAVVAALIVGQRGLVRRPLTTTYLCWGFGTLLMATYALARTTWHAMLTTAAMYALMSVGVILWATLMQRLVPPHLLGRVSAVDFVASTGLLPLSFALTGPLGEAFGAETVLLGAGVCGCAAVLVFLLVPGVRRTDHDPRLGAHPEAAPADASL